MRWVSCLLVAMVLLVGPAAAEEEPKGDAAPTIESEAERVRTAAKAKDTAQLKDIADNGAFGPWMLVEHLLGAGHADAAAAFAEQTEDSTALAAYITAQRDRKPNLAQRELLRRADRELELDR